MHRPSYTGRTFSTYPDKSELDVIALYFKTEKDRDHMTRNKMNENYKIIILHIIVDTDIIVKPYIVHLSLEERFQCIPIRRIINSDSSNFYSYSLSSFLFSSLQSVNISFYSRVARQLSR